MAHKAKVRTLKHAAYILLLTATMAGGWQALFSKAKSVHAEDLGKKKITKDSLSAFYDRSVDVQLAGEEQAVAFYKKHLHKDYEGVMHVSTRVDNVLQQQETIVLTKYEYLRTTEKAYRMSTFKELQSGVVSYNISEDGRSAKVSDRTYLMSVLPQTKTQSYNLRQFVSCDQFYILSEEDVLQLKSSTCQVEGQMSKAHAL